MDVYVASEFLFTRNDPAIIAIAGLYPYGLHNLQNPMRGKYLVFMPFDTEDPGKLKIYEIRVWSFKDIAPQGTVDHGHALFVGPTGNYCMVNCPAGYFT